jgi:peptidoglycan/LPS O-acetylase OafA/YrhL
VLSRPLGFTVVWVISVLLQRFIDVPPYFALDGVVYLMPFFLAGLACKRFELDSKTSRSVAMAALIVAATWLWVLWGPQPLPTRDTLLPGLVVGLSSAFLLLRSGWRSPWLACVGSYSFAIYLLHVFFTAGSRIFFTQLQLTNTYALLLLGTPLGIVGPIIAAKVISRSARWNRWLLGSSTKEKFSPTPTLLSDVAVETEQR